GTQEGSAKSGKDFRNQRGVVTFQPGQTKKIVSIPILGDRVDENNEQFQVKLSGAENGKFSDNKAVGKIIDNDQVSQISISDAKVVEGNRGQKNMEFEVRLNNPSSQTVKVNYTTVDGNAKSGKDYQKKSGVVTFKPGETKKSINISILGDTFYENTELFEVKLTRAQNAELPADPRKQYGAAIILDNDELPKISIGDAKMTEANRGKKNMEFAVRLNNPSDQTVKVNYASVDGTAKSGKDFQSQKGVVTFKPGETKKTVNIPILGDTLVENTEQFQVKLNGAKNAELSDSQAVGRIQDNDQPPQISISDAKVTEANRGEKNMKFEVTLDNSSAQTVKVNYETINGSAKAGEDFQKKKGVLTFKPGERKKTVNVPILGDLVDENNEEFQVKLSDAKNGKLSDEKAVGRIIDNDISPKISIGDARVTEANRGEKNMKFEVKLDNSSSQTVKVNYETINGSAKAGEDFRKKKGVLTFKPGETKKTLNVPILGDTVYEKNEKFQVKLSGAKNAKLSDADAKAVGIIRDNEKPVPEVFKDAVDMGVLELKQTSSRDNIGFPVGPVDRNTEDYFRFEVEKEGLVTIFVDSFIQNLGIELYGEDESFLNQSNEEDITIEKIQTTLEKGVYYLKVFSIGSGRTDYNVSINIVES
ncbi:MAG: sodium:calcium exchanger, partial [Trichodesmium sp. St11_bin5]|nr:sodium:calcium exchanger [Trichodesmium sp. St11_bin5]